ncbi:MAG: hypothetical protein MUC49_21480 [Raineya sp.]|jgi:hypothetical protein|nr:hypothetical protein [Raineya sp.]
MIFDINKHSFEIKKRKGVRLSSIGWKEKDFQEMMYKNLDVLLPEDELLLIMQSRQWQEEPDLMAIDKNGNLYIFELKAWESQESNLLQVLRYGQIFGQSSYEDLNELYLKFFPNSNGLLSSLNEKFNTQLTKEEINQKQKFILITNGLDFKTRATIKYWSEQGINISSWIYKIYQVGDQILLDFETYRQTPNPYEDINEGYFILNTNIQGGEEDEIDMLTNQKAAAYFEPWKYKIEQINKGDKVFLYRSGVGIIAKGIGSGIIDKSSYRGEKEKWSNEEYSTKLIKFKKLSKPIKASEIKKISGVNYVFMQTMFSIDKDTGEKLWKID